MNKRKKQGKQIKAPNMPKGELEKGLPEGSIHSRAYYAQVELSREDFAEQAAEHVSFDQALFEQVSMRKTHLKKVQVLDSRLVVCDLANAEWAEATLCRVELIGCHLTGFQCSEALIQDVLFKECSGSFAQFALATFKAVRFEHCDLSEVNFMEASFSGVSIVECDLHNADFSGTRLVGVDLRGCRIDGVRVGPDELKGAVIDPQQALAFVRGMGVIVAPLEETREES
jgi:uncharacterized protein YjbI with pentapeptide repeats